MTPQRPTSVRGGPDFYDETTVDQVYVERAAIVAEAANTYRAKHGVKPAARDDFRIAAFGIDAQVGFCQPNASLFVPGAVEDTKRTLSWLYRNIDKITGLQPAARRRTRSSSPPGSSTTSRS